jgi:7,8-dihydropterin-6-yl-methyl-4-(beta-D-ribofuranosyl)aminobenzene 5'-phosphate synthase
LADSIPDDQSVWIETAKGSVVLLGCAHAGVINTLDYISQLTRGKPICAVIGGMHLSASGTDRLVATYRALKDYEPAILAPCHCTGDDASGFFKRRLPESWRECMAGSWFEFAL